MKRASSVHDADALRFQICQAAAHHFLAALDLKLFPPPIKKKA